MLKNLLMLIRARSCEDTAKFDLLLFWLLKYIIVRYLSDSGLKFCLSSSKILLYAEKLLSTAQEEIGNHI